MKIKSKSFYAVVFFSYLAGLWLMSVPLTGDQKVYLSIALEMRERASILVPYLFDEPNFLKPPFQYWMTLLGWQVFGVSLFGALLPSVLALLGSVFLVNRLFDAKNFLPGLLFAGALGTMTYGTTAQMEIWVVLFYLGAWCEWKKGNQFFALTLVGVMAWIKGPLYPVLWVISALGERFFSRQGLSQEAQDIDQSNRTFGPKLLAALALGTVIGLLWYGLAASSQWQAMKSEFFERENLGKLQTAQGTPWGLWMSFLYSLFPWLPMLLLGSFNKSVRTIWKKNGRLLLAYGLLPAIFFTFFPYRVNTYLFLLTPVFAWMASSVNEVAPRPEDRRAHLVMLGFVLFLAFLLGAVAFRLSQGEWIGFEVAGLLILNLALWVWTFFKRSWTHFAWVCLMIVNLIRVGGVQLGERDIQGLRAYLNQNPSVQFAYVIQDHDIWHEFGIVSAAIRQNIRRLNESQIDSYLKDSGVLLLNNEQQALAGPLNCQPWPRLKKRMKFPFKTLLFEGLSANDPEVVRTFQICQLK